MTKQTLEAMAMKLKTVADKYPVADKIKQYDSEKFHFVNIEEIGTLKLQYPKVFEGVEIKSYPKQDSDIKTAKGERGGRNVASIYSNFTSAAQDFTARKTSEVESELESNFIQEASNFIRYCISKGYATEQEIDSMVSMSIGTKQHDEYLLANEKYHVDINAYALVRIYGTNMAKISRDINVKMEVARDYLEENFPKEISENKSDRWLFDKLKHSMPNTWCHEVAQLFSYKEMLTEKYVAKANTLTIGTSDFKYAIAAAALYYTVANREFVRNDKHVEDQEKDATLDDYKVSGISSVFSLFALGTADFLYRYRALSNNITEINSKALAINTTVVVIKFDETVRPSIEAYYEQSGKMLDQKIRFVKEGDRIKFASGMYVENEAINGSFFQSKGKQVLGAKELSNIEDGERKDYLIKQYEGIQFKKNGIFTMNHEKYEGVVIHSILYKSMLKVWMADLVGLDNNPLPVNDISERITFDSSDTEVFTKEIESTGKKENYVPDVEMYENQSEVMNSGYVSEDAYYDNVYSNNVPDVSSEYVQY